VAVNFLRGSKCHPVKWSGLF